jgi:hypothetical protein
MELQDPIVLVSFFVAVTKYLTGTTYRRKDLLPGSREGETGRGQGKMTLLSDKMTLLSDILPPTRPHLQ